MTTTAQQLLLAALGRDAQIDVNALATQMPEVVAAIGRILRKRLIEVIPNNPGLFGTIRYQPLVAEGGVTGWKRPSDAMTVYRLEATGNTAVVGGGAIANGAEIGVVPFDDRALRAGDPSVYEFGGFFIGAGNTGDPVSGAINVLYASFPTAPSALASDIDARFPDQMVDFLVADLNVWFCKRDGRDAVRFEAEVAEWSALFAAWVGNATLNVSRRFTGVPMSASG